MENANLFRESGPHKSKRMVGAAAAEEPTPMEPHISGYYKHAIPDLDGYAPAAEPQFQMVFNV